MNIRLFKEFFLRYPNLIPGKKRPIEEESADWTMSTPNHTLDVPEFKLGYRNGSLEHIEMCPNWHSPARKLDISAEYGTDILLSMSTYYPALAQWRHHCDNHTSGWLHTYRSLPPMNLVEIIELITATQAEISDMLDDYFMFTDAAQCYTARHAKPRPV